MVNNSENKKQNKDRKTLRQLIKFMLVSSVVGIVQLILVNVLFYAMKGWKAPLPSFLNGIFSSRSIGVGNDNWGYVLPFFLSNLIANIYGYIQNEKTTFKSDAPAWCFAVYIVLIVCLILFSTWLQGIVANALMNRPSPFWRKLAPTVAAACAGTFQFLVLFPTEKYVLFKDRSHR